MAPARMVSFMEQHVERCETCLQDPDLKEEIAKITEIVLPESKIPKAIRQKTEQAAQDNENAKEKIDEGNNDTEVNEEEVETGDDPDPDVINTPDA